MNEEISLREIIHIVMKQKWLIVIVTAICMFVSGIVSVFVLDPTYETYSIVRVQSATNADNKPITDVQIFEETLKSSSTINALIEKNNLDPTEYTINMVRDMFNLEVVPQSNIMKIKVRGNSSEEVTKMANMLAYELGIRVEINDRTRIIVETEQKLESITNNIKVTEVKLDEAKKQLENTPEKLVRKDVLANQDFLRSIARERSNMNESNAAALELESELINPVYTELKSQITQSEISLNTLRQEEKILKEKIEQNQNRINEIELKSHNDKLDANKSIRILDDVNAIIINPAIEPEKPVGPKALINLIIAGLVGAMISLVYVFLRHYMRETPGSGVNV